MRLVYIFMDDSSDPLALQPWEWGPVDTIPETNDEDDRDRSCASQCPLAAIQSNHASIWHQDTDSGVYGCAVHYAHILEGVRRRSKKLQR